MSHLPAKHQFHVTTGNVDIKDYLNGLEPWLKEERDMGSIVEILRDNGIGKVYKIA